MFDHRKRCLANEASEKSEPEIRDIGDDPQVLAAAALVRKLDSDLKLVVGELRKCTGDPTGSGQASIQHDPRDDVAALLAGTPSSTLTVAIAENAWHSLRRQLRALEAAVPAARHRLRTLRTRLEIEEVTRLTPTLKASYGRVLDGLEAALLCLRDHHELLTRMHREGVGYDSLGIWKLSPREEQMLHGGGDSSLEFYLRTRRKATGLAEGETK
ncbi:MAG: hypothetical protein RBR19_08305 [Sedimentisphaerales bacterium]|jgi:hypothetical protein|nr:hypothetical protein [Sedimentisphaerales bacterium]NLT75657.1 hypothetical protein [Planctomycetota bacterium]